MYRADFDQHLKRYSRDRLPKLQIQTHEKVGLKGGFALVSRNEGADLMLEGQRLGSIAWRAGDIVYEPPIDMSERLSLEGYFDRWVGHAWQKAQRDAVAPKTI